MALSKKKAGAKKKVAKKAAKPASSIPVKSAQKTTAPARPATPFEELDRLFDEFLQRHWMRPFRWDLPSWREFPALRELQTPSVDIVDRDKEVFVRAELPAIDKKDLDVSLVERSLTIRGSSHKEEKEEGEDYYRQEIKSGSFSRTVLLPADVDAGKAKASYKDGILELTLPKLEESTRHKIRLP